MPTWSRCFSTTRKLHVTISNFKPISNSVDHDCGMLDAVGARSGIHCIQMLRIVNVEFRKAYLEDWNGEPKELELSDIDLGDVHRMLLDDLFELAQMGLQYPRITHSPLPYIDVALDMELILEDIPLHEDIAAFLQQWEGSDLDVIGCVAFDDHTLEVLEADHDANGPHTSHERRNFRIARTAPAFQQVR